MTIRQVLCATVCILLLAGCDKFVARNTAAIEVYYEQEHGKTYPVIIDPRLRTETNKYSRDKRDWFFGMDRKQRVVIHTTGPVKLVPAAPEDAASATATEQK